MEKVEKIQDQFCAECDEAMTLQLQLKGCEMAFTWYQHALLMKDDSSAESFKRIMEYAIEEYKKLVEEYKRMRDAA